MKYVRHMWMHLPLSLQSRKYIKKPKNATFLRVALRSNKGTNRNRCNWHSVF